MTGNNAVQLVEVDGKLEGGRVPTPQQNLVGNRAVERLRSHAHAGKNHAQVNIGLLGSLGSDHGYGNENVL